MKPRFAHTPFSAGFPFVRISILLPLLALLVVSTAWLIVRFRVLDSDSIMYGLPLAFAKGPFSLSIPLIGDFPPYSTVWGHQWPGAMWIRGAIFSVIPFERWLDISLLLSLQVGAAFLAGYLVWSLTRGPAVAICTTLIILSDRVLIAGLQLHRFEALTILALVALMAALIKTSGGQGKGEGAEIQNPKSKIQNFPSNWAAGGLIAAFVAACTHPFGMAMAAGFVGMAGIDWLILRRRAAMAALIPSAGFVLGLASVGVYYFLVPGAREQFVSNVALQNSFNEGSRLGFFTTHLRYYHWLGYPLWAAVLVSVPFVFVTLSRRRDAGASFAAWALPLAALAIPALFILTRSANNSYATLGTPFAAILVATAVGLIHRAKHPLRRAALIGLLCFLTLGFLSVYPYRWYVFVKSGMPDFPGALQAVVNRMPEGVRVYIPPPLWDVASHDKSRDYRLYTLSIASPWTTRLAYEKKVYAEAKPGDFLVIDRVSGKTGDPWGILPTFETRPPDARYWKPAFESIRRIPGAGNDFGYDLAVYEFLGEPWDPQSTPRNSIKGR